MSIHYAEHSLRQSNVDSGGLISIARSLSLPTRPNPRNSLPFATELRSSN
jgi:hypothetical protein